VAIIAADGWLESDGPAVLLPKVECLEDISYWTLEEIAG
jgi:hypothetical protein